MSLRFKWIACDVFALTLKAISQMPQQNDAATKVEHSQKILRVSFVAYDPPAKVLQPGKQPLDLPAPTITPHAA
jgi:hypothetical protein